MFARRADHGRLCSGLFRVTGHLLADGGEFFRSRTDRLRALRDFLHAAAQFLEESGELFTDLPDRILPGDRDFFREVALRRDGHNPENLIDFVAQIEGSLDVLGHIGGEFDDLEWLAIKVENRIVRRLNPDSLPPLPIRLYSAA